MYQAYWGLNQQPFTYRTSSTDLYRSRSLQAAQLRLRYCFDNNAGAAMLVGPSGAGKSSVLRLAQADHPELTPFVHLAYPTLSPEELLHTIAAELEMDRSARSDHQSLLPRVLDCLRSRTQDDTHAVLALDEAHLLNQETLNGVVLPVLNAAENDVDLKLTVILAGQQVLGSTLSRNAQLRERIAITAVMEGFSAVETADYIRTRLLTSGTDRQVFDQAALEAIYAISQGNPRRVNRLCDMALLVGYADQKTTLTARDIESLSTEFLPAAA